MRLLHVVHSLPGRTRLRARWLRREPATVDALADAFAQLPGVHEINVRPYTGSILVTHERELTIDDVITAAQRVLAADRVLALGERAPRSTQTPELSKIAQLAATAFREIDREVLRRTGGSFDLGTLATLGFFSAGAAELVIERQIATPPWWNLAWWGYRTFMTNEQEEIAAATADGGGDDKP